MWKLLGDLNFYTNGKYTDNVKTFCVEASNEGQNKTAREWAESNMHGDCEVFGFKNDGFTAKIKSSAGVSYERSGRLSFWTVEIEKEGKKFNVGISDKLLFECMMNSAIINGEIHGKVVFAKNGNNLGIVPMDSNIYNEVLKDTERRGEVSKSKKTVVRKLGYCYETPTKKNVYLGRVLVYSTVSNTLIERHWFPDLALVKRYKKLSELVASEDFETVLLKSDRPSNLQPRVQGEQVIEFDMTEDELQNALREKVLKKYSKFKDIVERKGDQYARSVAYKEYPGASAFSFKKDEILMNKNLYNIVYRGV